MARVRFVETLKLLAHNDVEFIVVGMTSAVLQGVPLTTLDCKCSPVPVVTG